MFSAFVARAGRVVLIGAGCWACAGSAAPLTAAGREDLVPANFQALTDGQGNSWNVQPQGMLNTGDNVFNNALTIGVGNINFSPRQTQMTRDQREYVLSGTCGNVHVVRRIEFDPAAASARYVEILTNNGPSDLSDLAVRLSTSFQMHTVFYSDSGAANPVALDAQSSGLVIVNRVFNQMPSLSFWLASAKSKNKPDIAYVNGRQLRVTYKISLPRGASVALLHGIALQPSAPAVANPNQPPDAATIASIMKPLDAKAWVKGLSPEIRRKLANYSGSTTFDAPGLVAPLQPMNELLEQARVERGESDTLVLDDGTALKGAATWKSLSVKTAYGKADLHIEDVALIYGGLGGSRSPRVYLRTGEVLVGETTATDCSLQVDDGLEVELVPALMNLLILHVAPLDNQAPRGATALVTTSSGNRVAVKVGAESKLSAATAWGPLSAALADVQSLSYQSVPQPGFRLNLRDRTQLPVLLVGPAWKLDTLRWGPVSLAAGALRRFDRFDKVRPAGKEPALGEEAASGDPAGGDPAGGDPAGDDEPGAITTPHLRLAGDSILVGEIVEPRLQVSIGGGMKSLEFRSIASLARNDSGDGSFQCKSVDGSFFTCVPQDSLVTLRRGNQQWRVPISQVFGLRGAPPKAAPVAAAPGSTAPVKPRRPPATVRPESIGRKPPATTPKVPFPVAEDVDPFEGEPDEDGEDQMESSDSDN